MVTKLYTTLCILYFYTIPYFLGEWRWRLEAFYQSGQYTAVPISQSRKLCKRWLTLKDGFVRLLIANHFRSKIESWSIQKIIYATTDKDFYNLDRSFGRYIVKRHTFNIWYCINQYKILCDLKWKKLFSLFSHKYKLFFISKIIWYKSDLIQIWTAKWPSGSNNLVFANWNISFTSYDVNRIDLKR